MTPWIALTEERVNANLTPSQRESLSVRPNQEEANDVLSVAIEEITEQVREAIRAHETNILSNDATLLPPELVTDAALLAIEQLEERIPGFYLTDSQFDSISTANSTVSRVRSGSLPVSIPEGPESVPQVRRSFGPEVVHKRDDRLSGNRLGGL